MAPVRTRLPAGLTVCLAGGFLVCRDGRQVPVAEIGSRKARQLLHLLAVRRGRIVGVQTIVTALWGDDRPKRPADNLATLVSRLRAALGPDVVTGDRDGYRLGVPPAIQVDLDVAAAHLAEARRRMAGEPALARTAAAAAIDLVDHPGPDEASDLDDPARQEAAQLLAGARLVGAQAALQLNEPAVALTLASAALDSDGYDEQACRLVMRAHAALGEPARALAAYEKLRALLVKEFGVDPSAQTREIHLSILREERPVQAQPQPPRATATLAGREAEVMQLTGHWTATANGAPALVLLAGEAGIGKTRLSQELGDLVASTGGTVLSARCYETERSLFLQPMAEALGHHAARTPPTVLRHLAGDWAAPLTQLVPEIATALGLSDQPGDAEVQRHRAYRAVTEYLCRLGARPVLLLLDDLQNAGLDTVELLHYLIRHAGSARLLMVATIRVEEGAATIDALAGVSSVIELGPLSPAAVARLATEAGHAGLAANISIRTGGHTLFVVETLRSLASGGSGLPTSMQAAVLARVRRTGEPVEQLLRAAAVLGATIDPDTLARMLDIPPMRATALCERAFAARLLVVADRAYEFANDLIREVLYASMPAPSRLAYHRRAADLLAARPEAVAAHAVAAGDLPRAARAWLLAGEEAERRFAAADAQVLLSNAVAAGQEIGDLEVVGRALLARGRVRDVLARHADAVDDFQAAVAAARASGDRRLEMLAHRELGGDVRVALGMPVSECTNDLTRALRLAAALGDRGTESAILARLAILACNRLDFVAGLDYGRRAVQSARAAPDDIALAAALDGLKTGYAYLGELSELAAVVAELEPLLRQQRDLHRLAWLVQENAFISIAAAGWPTALDQLQTALELNRRSGYTAFEGWFVGHIGWVMRLSGDLGAALDYGHRAVDLTTTGRHAWWRAATCAYLGTTLLATGDKAAAQAMLATGRDHAPPEGAEAYRLRCLGPLAEVTGDCAVLATADRMLAGIVTAPGQAWLPGVDAYLSIGRAWLAQDEPARAAAAMRPLHAAATRAGWHWVADAVRRTVPV